MMRQTAIAESTLDKSGRSLRLDPDVLPVRYTATLGEPLRKVDATIILDHNDAIVRCPSPSGQIMTIRMPISAFDGVAVRMTPVGTDGDIEVAVELTHPDPALSLPLMIADDPADVATEWQAWGESLQLPLLLVGEDGTIVEADGQDEKPASRMPKPRRRHSFFADRRPRFLTRRKTGRSGPLERVNGREIIAPE